MASYVLHDCVLNVTGNVDYIAIITGNCGNPPAITYTTVSLNAAGIVATYACVDGYNLVNANNEQLTCDANNQWTGARPQCRIRGMCERNKYESGHKKTILIAQQTNNNICIILINLTQT